MSAAVDRGFNAMRPWGDSSAYDVVLEKAGRFFRMQMKSAGVWCYLSRRNHGLPVYAFMTARSHNRRYLASEFDFYALYVIPGDLWYILPPRALRGRRCA